MTNQNIIAKGYINKKVFFIIMNWEDKFKNIQKPPKLGKNVVEALNKEDLNIFQAGMNYLIRIDKTLNQESFSNEDNEDRKHIIESINMYYADLRKLSGNLNKLEEIKNILHAFKVIYIKMKEEEEE